MSTRLLKGLLGAAVFAVISLIINLIMGSMDWNHLIGTTIGGFVVGFFFISFTSRKSQSKKQD